MNKSFGNLLSCTMEADFFIVGQGLAGSLLAYELLKRNKRVLVFDDHRPPKASDVAAGLINPVVFRRMTKSWLVDDAFPLMEDTYRQLELLLDRQLYFPAQMIKFLSEDAALLWKNKSFANQLLAYLVPDPVLKERSTAPESISSVGLITKSGRFDIQNFIYSFRTRLESQNLLVSEHFDYSKLLFSADRICYDNFSASKVIFCEGSAASANPFFKGLHFKHSKGEVLELKMPGFPSDKIINDQVFIMPLGHDRFKAGATYTWDRLDWEPTASGKEELVAKLKKITSSEIEIVLHQAGIRPTMHDRKPVIGLLPENSKIGIFNGLGSKGVLLGPYFASQLADFLTGASNFIHPEANVLRYYLPGTKSKL